MKQSHIATVTDVMEIMRRELCAYGIVISIEIHAVNHKNVTANAILRFIIESISPEKAGFVEEVNEEDSSEDEDGDPDEDGEEIKDKEAPLPEVPVGGDDSNTSKERKTNVVDKGKSNAAEAAPKAQRVALLTPMVFSVAAHETMQYQEDWERVAREELY